MSLTSLFQKRRPVFHICAATVIVAYWWATWNTLDALFLGHTLHLGQWIAVVGVALTSIILLFVFDFDFSDL